MVERRCSTEEQVYFHNLLIYLTKRPLKEIVPKIHALDNKILKSDIFISWTNLGWSVKIVQLFHNKAPDKKNGKALFC